jgi:septum formation protein
LASQSPYRKALLENFGLKFEAISPKVNEEELKTRGPHDPVELTRFLAFEKALSLQKMFPSSIILGSDQLAEIDGKRLDKPLNLQGAIAQLQLLQGRTHRLITSLCVIAPSSTHTFTDITKVHLRKLGDAEIKAYLELDQPFDCAGSYKIEKAGMALVEKLETADPSAIQGLPLISLTQALQDLAIPWSAMWRKT